MTVTTATAKAGSEEGIKAYYKNKIEVNLSNLSTLTLKLAHF
jgi:hypothetical protein